MAKSLFPLDDKLIQRLYTDGMSGEVFAQMVFLALADPMKWKIHHYLWRNVAQYLKGFVPAETIEYIKRKTVEC